MRNLCQRFNIDNVTCRITNCFAEHCPGFVIDERGNTFRFIISSKPDFNALLGKHMSKKRISTTVQLRRCHNIGTYFRNVLNGIGNCRTACAYRQCTNTAFQISNALLEYISGRIHDSGVNISRHSEIKKVSAVLCVVKLIRNSLINWHSHRVGSGISGIT